MADSPLSWLELERLHLGELSTTKAADVRRRLAQDPEAQAMMHTIEAPVVMPPLLSAEAKPALKWSQWRWPMLSLAIAAAALMILVRRPPSAQKVESYVGVKGGETFSIALIAQRNGQLVNINGQAFTEDRLKVVLTCSPPETRMVGLVVYQDGEASHPIAGRSEIQCGNRVPVPGAFRLDPGPARVCVTTALNHTPFCIEIKVDP